MAYWKTFQANNNKIKIPKTEAEQLIINAYGEKNLDRHMKTLHTTGIFDVGYWMVEYEY